MSFIVMIQAGAGSAFGHWYADDGVKLVVFNYYKYDIWKNTITVIIIAVW